MRCKSLLVTLPIVCGALTSGALSASLDAKLQSHPFYPLTVGSSWKYHEHQSVKAPNTWEIEKKVLSAKELPDGHIRFTVETATVAKPYYHDRVKSYYEVRDGWVVCTGGPDEEYRPPVKVMPPEPKTGITWHTKSALYRRDGKNWCSPPQRSTTVRSSQASTRTRMRSVCMIMITITTRMMFMSAELV
jgi:hypothetical protein